MTRSATEMLRLLLWRLWLPALIVGLWWITSTTNSSLYYPPLPNILSEIVDDWILGPRLTRDLLPTLQNFFKGLSIALIGGTVVGVVLGRSS